MNWNRIENNNNLTIDLNIELRFNIFCFYISIIHIYLILTDRPSICHTPAMTNTFKK